MNCPLVSLDLNFFRAKGLSTPLVSPHLSHLSRTQAVLLNTSRGGLVDSKALIAALKVKKLGAVGLDTYEEEVSTCVLVCGCSHTYQTPLIDIPNEIYGRCVIHVDRSEA